jgi:hypothetical protein
MMPPGLDGLLAPVVTPGALLSRARSCAYRVLAHRLFKKPPEPKIREAQRLKKSAAQPQLREDDDDQVGFQSVWSTSSTPFRQIGWPRG